MLVRQAAVLVRLVRDAASLWCTSRSVVVRESLVRESMVRESDDVVRESARRSARITCFT